MGLSDSSLIGADFYDRWTELFLHGSGPVLQAGLIKTGHPPREDPGGSVLALAARAGLRDGERVLDAGCGVAGPAVIIAQHHPGVIIEGVTNSARQATLARGFIAEAGLGSRVRVHVADYQALPFRPASFDRVVFFESTGYATDLSAACREAHRVLKPGGTLYVKDVFRRGGTLRADEDEAMEGFDRLWGCVRSKTVEESVAVMTAAGFEVARSGVMPDVGTARLAGSMVTLGGDGAIDLTDLGRAFLRKELTAPIEFAEILAVKPSAQAQ